MEVGQAHSEHHEITQELVAEFARLSGDFNPIHLDAEYARTTKFGRPIAHGMLTSALLSGILGTRFPGSGTILLASNMNFMAPVFVGERIEIKLSVEHVRPDKPIVTLFCQVLDSKGQTTSEGRIILKITAKNL